MPHIYFKENNGLVGLTGLIPNLKRIYRKKLTKDYSFDESFKFLKNILLPSYNDNNSNNKNIINSDNNIKNNEELLIHDQIDLNKAK